MLKTRKRKQADWVTNSCTPGLQTTGYGCNQHWQKKRAWKITSPFDLFIFTVDLYCWALLFLNKLSSLESCITNTWKKPLLMSWCRPTHLLCTVFLIGNLAGYPCTSTHSVFWFQYLTTKIIHIRDSFGINVFIRQAARLPIKGLHWFCCWSTVLTQIRSHHRIFTIAISVLYLFSQHWRAGNGLLRVQGPNLDKNKNNLFKLGHDTRFSLPVLWGPWIFQTCYNTWYKPLVNIQVPAGLSPPVPRSPSVLHRPPQR